MYIANKNSLIDLAYQEQYANLDVFWCDENMLEEDQVDHSVRMHKSVLKKIIEKIIFF